MCSWNQHTRRHYARVTSLWWHSDQSQLHASGATWVLILQLALPPRTCLRFSKTAKTLESIMHEQSNMSATRWKLVHAAMCCKCTMQCNHRSSFYCKWINMYKWITASSDPVLGPSFSWACHAFGWTLSSGPANCWACPNQCMQLSPSDTESTSKCTRRAPHDCKWYECTAINKIDV